MQKFFIFLITCCLANSIQAQQKLLTIEDAMLNARTSLAPENLKQLQFIKGTSNYVYLKKVNGTEMWMTGSFAAAKESEFLSLFGFNAFLKKGSIDTVTSMPAISFSKDNYIATIKGQKISIRPSTNTVEVILNSKFSDREYVETSAAGYISYVEGNNLLISKNGNISQVTSDGSDKIVYGSTVHQSEFGITKGTFWSNNGKVLAFYKMDQSMVPDYPIINWNERPAKVENLKYPMAGDKSHHVTLGIYNAETEKTIWVKTEGPEEQYLTNIAWSPDDQFVYIVIVNREQNHFSVNQYNATTGAFVKTLFEETDSKYAEPLVPMQFVKNNPTQFIWQSKRDGWNHLYLYGADGKLIKQLTTGNWEVTEVKGFDDKGENLFFVSTISSPISKNLCSINLKTGKLSTITEGDQVHANSYSTDGAYVLDNFSNPNNPRTIQLIETKSGKKKILLAASNPLANYKQGTLSIFTIKNNKGDDLYCRLFKPTDFDSTRKYPVIVYWYGGPHAQMITNSWNGGAGDYWFQYMAERGFVVFTLDTRGSSNRGKAFEQEIHRNAGKYQMEDLMSGVNYLNELSFTDKNKMGLFGWSYGGFMTIDFMLNHPGIFRTAVAGGPVTDWKFYEIMYTERYMDSPQENPDGFEATDLTKQIEKLKGKLLLIHGMQDNVVVMQHSVNLVKAAVDKGIQVDYMIYPGHEHNVLGKDRAHLYKKVTDYFMQNLAQ
jgi:dipeptidyl-peptidase-4